ncbi:MAG: ABC transporter ATP-binding protein [Victivallales bacterium]|nr:ABC transporter ATP-binding protein [Victivallales bacterium]
MASPAKSSQAPPRPARPNHFAEVDHAANVRGTIRRIGRYFGAEPGLVLGTLAFVLGGTLCTVAAPTIISHAIDLIAQVANGSLPATLLALVLLLLIGEGLQLLQGFATARLSLRIVQRLREELFGKVVDLPLKYLDGHSHGDVMSRMTNDIEMISMTVSMALPTFFSGILTIIGVMAVMFYHCWQLTLLSCLSVVLTLGATRFLSAKVRKFSRRRQELLGKLNGTVEEQVAGYRTVVACNHQKATIDAFAQTSDHLTSAGIRMEIFAGVMGPVMNCIGNIGFVIIAACGGYFAYRGIISVGIIAAFILYAKQFARPVNMIAQIYGQLQTAVAGAERVFTVMDEESEDPSGKPMHDGTSAHLEFRHVNFSYLPGKPVIQDFTLPVPTGQKIAVVGATGSGKTTIANLLLRFYDPDNGQILINGQNLSEMARGSLRRQVAIVLQDTVLFTDTVESNLRYANADATPEQLNYAIDASHCREVIDHLPDGLDTILTGAGANLSQGQRQLLAIARAFVADPRILIFDEATSSVDTRTEKAIQTAMQRVMRNRTSIIIAHRLSTIRDADLIVVMDQGRIVEQGNHEELLAQRGKYHELYMTQFAGLAT